MLGIIFYVLCIFIFDSNKKEKKNMEPTPETKISSPSVVMKITSIKGIQPKKNVVSSLYESSRELEKDGHEYKESSSTQTSSSSSLLHKRKVNSYATNYGFQRSINRRVLALLNRPRKNPNPTSQRVLSAKLLQVKQLQSELVEAHRQITDLQDENRTWKNLYKRQDSALRKYESQDSHLPQLLKSHEEEIRVLTLRYKKLRCSHNDLESRYNKQFSELMSIKDRHTHLLQISQDKNLLRREQLTKQIEDFRIVINDLNDKIRLQARQLDLKIRNFKHQLTSEFQKQKVLQEQLKQSNEMIQKLHAILEVKDRVIASCKINHHVVMKTSQNQLNKLRTSSLKQTRNRTCLGEDQKEKHQDNVKTNMKNISKTDQEPESENTETNARIITTMKAEGNERETHQNVNAEKINSTVDLTVFTKTSIVESMKKSDSNNNTKINEPIPQKSCKNSIETLYLSSNVSDVENFSVGTFGFFDKTDDIHEEISSDRIEDFSPTEDIVSWLEVHEKLNGKVNVASAKSSPIPPTLHTDFGKNVSYISQPVSDLFKAPNFNFPDDILTGDKKSDLLQVLKDIDYEKNSVCKKLQVTNNLRMNSKSSKK